MDIEQLHSYILDRFNQPELARLVKFRLDTDLGSIAAGDNFSDIVFSLVDWASRHNALDELAAAVGLGQWSGMNSDEQMKNQGSMDLILFRIERLEKSFEQLNNIIVGSNGIGGLYADSSDKFKKLSELEHVLFAIQSDQKKLATSLNEMRSFAFYGLPKILQVAIMALVMIMIGAGGSFILYTLGWI